MKTITRKSLLYRTNVEYGDYTINHVLGCAHGCLFPCYAFNIARRFGYVKSYDEWIEPKIVSNALEILEREIPKHKNKIKSVQLCFTTDPFMVCYEDVTKLTIKIIERLNKDGIKVVTLTKGVIPEEALITKKYNEFGITLISINEDFRNEYEPFTAKYVDRILSLRKMHEAGFKTWVSIEPYPTPNLVDQNLSELLNEIAFVDYIVFGRWHCNKKVSVFKEYKEYYNECADEVISFCKKHNIKLHIKNGTLTKKHV